MQTHNLDDTVHDAVVDIKEFLEGKRVVKELVNSYFSVKAVPDEDEYSFRVDVVLEADAERYEEAGLDLPEQTRLEETYWPDVRTKEDLPFLYNEWTEGLLEESHLESKENGHYMSFSGTERSQTESPKGVSNS